MEMEHYGYVRIFSPNIGSKMILLKEPETLPQTGNNKYHPGGSNILNSKIIIISHNPNNYSFHI